MAQKIDAEIDLNDVVAMNVRVGLALRGKTQADLAREMGMSRGGITMKMKRRAAWSVSDIEKAGRFLNIAPAKFLEPNGLVVAGSGFEPETSGL